MNPDNTLSSAAEPYSFDQNQAQCFIGPDLGPNCLTLMVFLKEILKKLPSRQRVNIPFKQLFLPPDLTFPSYFCKANIGTDKQSVPSKDTTSGDTMLSIKMPI